MDKRITGRMLLAMDIDGTSVGRDHRLGEKTRQALRRFRQAGHVVCFASGRNEFDMWNMCGDHREADYVICNTGGKILRAADDAVLSLHLADAESVRALAGACLGHNDCVLYVIAAGYMGVSRMTPGVREYTDSIRCRPAVYASAEELPLAGVQIPNIPLGVIVLFMNSGAYLCEIFRAGIQSIPKGQFEASRSLGMNGAQTMLFVIIPQTVRRVIPTMTSEFILLYKDTSMLAAVGVMEIVMYAKTIVAATGSITPYIVAALFYLIITLPLAKVVGKLEARLAGNDTGQATPKRKKRAKKRGVVKDMSHRPANETRDAVDAARGSGSGTGITPEQMSSL